MVNSDAGVSLRVKKNKTLILGDLERNGKRGGARVKALLVQRLCKSAFAVGDEIIALLIQQKAADTIVIRRTVAQAKVMLPSRIMRSKSVDLPSTKLSMTFG